ncbi:hypothetical protein CVT24_010405 [Panaeolus cyanescens]|uniref:DNA polymerase V n=1 Tax=Panaeolus cyanescens TaxID=181874 RepID=A0A409YPL3_9AGAR|nr:hypothetical protein CVT24_010405 [Panaeolus cyanescens]
MTTTLPLFWHLSSASKKERLDASVKLVGALEQFQAQFVQKPPAPASSSEDEDEDDEPSRSDELDALNAHDVSYSLRRLVRGLASPRESSRLGFAVALTELLSRIDTVSCSQILNLLIESTKHQGSMNGQDERDVLFGKLFGITSIIQSGLIVRTKPLPSSASSTTSASSLEGFQQVISNLVELGEQKSWLRESAWFSICLAIDVLHESEVPWKAEAVDALLQQLFVENTLWSTEKYAMGLKLQELYPDQDWKTLLSSVFKNPVLVHSSNLPVVSRLLKESTIDEDGVKDASKAPSGTWKPQLNFAWDIILDQMLPGPNSSKPAKGSFQDFYRVVVDETLFASTSSAQRKYWGFQVFQKALKRVKEDGMAMLFTKNFMRSWINHLAKADRYLHKVALQTATEVQAFVTDKPQLGFALILQLTGVNGSQQFDKLTKTKTVESILSSLDAKGIQKYIDHLLGQVDDSDADSDDATVTNTRRAWIIDQLSTLIRNSKIPKEDQWVETILNWFIVHGLFSVKKKNTKSPFAALHSVPNPIFSDELRKTCRSKLLVCLGDLSNQLSTISQQGKTVKVSGAASDGEFWLKKAFSTIQQLQQDVKHVALLEDLDEDEVELLNKAQEQITRLEKVTGSEQEAAKGAELLILGSILQQYCAADDEEHFDPDALETCVDGASRLFHVEDKKKKKKKDKQKASEQAQEDQEEPIDLLVDTIIGFLEKSTAYMRTVGNQAFALLAGSVKESTIDLIVAQLERKSSSQLLEAEDEDEDMTSAEDEENGEEDEDADEDEDEEEDEDEPSEDEDEGEDSNDEDEDTELRRKIEEALRVNGIEPATGETDTEDEELMDDDQMMEIDKQLAAAFRSRANEQAKGKNTNAQREATHFKNRVLDLVETFLRKLPSSPHILRLIGPLIDIVAGSSQDERQLSDKANGILRSRLGKAKEFPSGVDAQQAETIASEIHTQALKTHNSQLLSTLSGCLLYLGKILIQLGKESYLQDLYRQALTDFATRKNSSFNPSFFQDFVRRYPALAWSLAQEMLDLESKAINAYRQIQVLHLLEVLISLLPSVTEKNQEALDFMPTLQKRLLAIVTESCSDDGKLNAAQLKDVFKLAMLSVKQTKRISPERVSTIWDSKAWEQLRQTLSQSTRFKASTGLQTTCKQISQLSAAQDTKEAKATKPSKRKADEANDDASSKATKKAKHKKAKGDTS